MNIIHYQLKSVFQFEYFNLLFPEITTTEKDYLDHIEKSLHNKISNLFLEIINIEWPGECYIAKTVRSGYVYFQFGMDLIQFNEDKVYNIEKAERIIGLCNTLFVYPKIFIYNYDNYTDKAEKVKISKNGKLKVDL